MEGWPAYTLEDAGDGATLVRHHVALRTHGAYHLATPVLGVIRPPRAHRRADRARGVVPVDPLTWIRQDRCQKS